MTSKIYCFGNKYLVEDKIALTLAQRIKNYKGYDFLVSEEPWAILNERGVIFIMDVIKGLKKVSFLESSACLKLSSSCTCHDLDLSFFLKLLSKIGNLKGVKIIGLPWGECNLDSLEKEVKSIIDSV